MNRDGDGEGAEGKRENERKGGEREEESRGDVQDETTGRGETLTRRVG